MKKTKKKPTAITANVKANVELVTTSLVSITKDGKVHPSVRALAADFLLDMVLPKPTRTVRLDAESKRALFLLAGFSNKSQPEYLRDLIEAARKKHNRDIPKFIDRNSYLKLTKDTPTERFRIKKLVEYYTI